MKIFFWQLTTSVNAKMDFTLIRRPVFVYHVTVIVKHAQIKDPVKVAQMEHSWVIVINA